MDIFILIVILIAVTILYITRWLPTEVVALLTIASLALTGLLTSEQALAGFASTATLTVGAMFVLSGGLLRTGALETVTIYLARFSNGSPTRLLLLLSLTIPIASAFMNNTPVVVMMVPVILSLSQAFQVRPSKLLIPVSYFAVLGGTMTLLGTSTNILIDDLYRQAGGPGFGLFSFAPLGLLFSVLGAVFIVTFSQRLLPNRAPLSGLVRTRRRDVNFVTELVIDRHSQLLGKSVLDVFDTLPSSPTTRPRPGRHHRRVGQLPRASQEQSRTENTIELLELFRDGHIYRAEEGQGLTLEEGDALIISGTPKVIARFLEDTETQLASVLEDETRMPVQTVEQNVVEAVVLPDSPCNSRPIGNLGLNRRYGVKVMGLQRRGGHRRVGLRNTRLQSGDVLLLQGKPDGLRMASETLKLLLVEGVEGSILRSTKNRTALLIMAGVVLLASLTNTPIVVLAVAGAGLMILTKCLRVDEALDALDPATLLLLAGTIPLGTAMQTTGLASAIVQQLLRIAGMASPVVFLSAFYLFTSLLTQIVSNNAVAVLLTPIALSLAPRLGVNPTPLLMAIAFGASASFMTPMGYQTNAIVMGPGGYTFADYLRMGVPLQLLTWLAATVCIPLFWPL